MREIEVVADEATGRVSVETRESKPGKRHREALGRAGVRPDLLRLVPDVFVFTLGTRLLQLEEDAATTQRNLLRSLDAARDLDPGAFATSWSSQTEKLLTARATLVGARYGVEAALGALEWQANREREKAKR